MRDLAVITFLYTLCASASIHALPAPPPSNPECGGVQQRIRQLTNIIGRDQEAIANLGFVRDAQALKKWTEVTEKEKSDWEQVRLDAFVTDLLGGIAQSAIYLKSLNPWSVNRTIKQLPAIIQEQPVAQQAIRYIAAIKHKPQISGGVEYGKAIVEGLVQGKESAEGLGSNDSVDALTALAQLSVALLKNPQTQIISSESVSAISILYHDLKRRGDVPDLKALINADNQKLAALNEITKVLKEHVDQLRAVNAQLQACTDIAGQWNCGGHQATITREDSGRYRLGSSEGCPPTNLIEEGLLFVGNSPSTDKCLETKIEMHLETSDSLAVHITWTVTPNMVGDLAKGGDSMVCHRM